MEPLEALFTDFFAFWFVFFTLMGMTIGSFINVVIDRLPEGKSIFVPGSHCSACGRPVAAIDLIPVFNYLWLKGRCRYCQAVIPRRLPLVEMGIGGLFGYLFWFYGFGPDFAIAIFYSCLFFVLMVIDLERRLILNKLVYPGMAVALALSLLWPDLEIVPTFASAAGGGGFGLGLFLAIAVVSGGGMGMGDVKMAALIGLMVGFPLIVVASFLSIIMGGSVAAILLIFKLKGRKQGIPFAPYLAVAAIATMLYGNEIKDWYLGLV